VRERSGHGTRWARGAPEDAQVEGWVGDLLAHGLTQAAAIEIALVNNPRAAGDLRELGVSRPTWSRPAC